MKQHEAKVSKDIANLMMSAGAWSFNVHGHAMQMVGVPDLIFCLDGLFVAIEVKDDSPTTAQGNASPIQLKRFRDIRSALGIVFVARTIDDVKAFLSKQYHIVNFEIMYDKKDESYITNDVCSITQYRKWISTFTKE